MIGVLPTKNGYISDIHFGELGDITTASSVGASSSSKFCDIYYYYSGSANITVYSVCGKIVEDMQCGFFSSDISANGVSAATLYYGTRLCFLPAE